MAEPSERIVLAPAASDTAHPALSTLFVRTEFAADIAVLAARRRRSTDEPSVWAAHLALVEGDEAGPARLDTDRARASWRQCAASLGHFLERDGWHGGWYVRAFFDDGTTLGAHAGAECQIDSIAHS